MNLDAKAPKKQKIQIDNAPGKKRKKGASLDVRKARAGWLFILPFLIGFVLIYLHVVV